MRSLSLCLALTASLVAPLHSVRAQTTGPLAPGDRIRVVARRALNPPLREGTVLAVGADSLVLRLQPRGDSVVMQMAQVTSLEVSRGWRSNTRKGLTIGAVSGVVLGAVAGAATYKPCVSQCYIDFGAGPSVAGGALLGGLVGLAMGSVIGSLRQSEQWARVPLRTAGHLSAVPDSRGGATVSFAMRF